MACQNAWLRILHRFFRKLFLFFRFFEKFWLGGAAPQTPRFLAGGAKPPQTPPLNGRSSHLIEAAKRGRLDQISFFRRH